MPRKRRLFDGAFKAKVALDAIRGLKTVSELAALHKVALDKIDRNIPEQRQPP